VGGGGADVGAPVVGASVATGALVDVEAELEADVDVGVVVVELDAVVDSGAATVSSSLHAAPMSNAVESATARTRCLTGASDG
jgi:hypothetical protein